MHSSEETADPGDAPTESALHIQVNQIDYFMMPPGELDICPYQVRVPVLRIYGPSSLGMKACAHIHQVYPYFYVEYAGSMEHRYVKKYMAKLQRSLNHAIAISTKQDPSSSKARYVRAIVVVKGVPFYGFHASYTPYLKIYLFDPSLVFRAVSILRSGTIMKTRFRIFESHLSFTLQFMCDFALYGCGWLELSQGWIRGSDDSEELSASALERSSYHKQSRMPLEVDVIAPHILNRHRISVRNLHSKLEIPTAPLRDEPLIDSVRELWDEERRRRLAKGLDPSIGFPPSNEQTRGKGGDWTAEARWWEELRQKLMDGPTEYINPRHEWDDYVMTSTESLESLWEPEFRVWRPKLDRGSDSGLPSLTDYHDVKEETDVEVDETFLASQPFEEEESQAEEWAELESFMESENVQPPQEGEDDPYDQDVEDEELDDIIVKQEEEEENPFLVEADDACSPDSELETFQSPNSPLDILDAEMYSSDSDDQIDPPFEMEPRQVANTQIETSVPAQLDANLPSPSQDSINVHDHPGPHGEFIEQANHLSANSQRKIIASTLLISAEALRRSSAKYYVYMHAPPSTSTLLTSLDEHNIPQKVYRDPFYMLPSDAPAAPREYAGLVYHLRGGDGLNILHPFDASTNAPYPVEPGDSIRLDPQGVCGWEYSGFPPSRKRVKKWLSQRVSMSPHVPNDHSSQIEGPTEAPKSRIKLDKSNPLQMIQSSMSNMSLEVFAPSCEDMQPNPKEDSIVAIMYAFRQVKDAPSYGTIVVGSEQLDPNRLRDASIETVSTELDLLHRFTDIVIELDPDILSGWDVQVSSWGYLNARGSTYGISIEELISRAPPRRQYGNDQWNTRHASTFRVAGRHVLNVWRIMRSELNLSLYSFANVVFHILQHRVPHYTSRTLTKWFNSLSSTQVKRLLSYFSKRTSTVLDILEESQMVTRTAEFARVFGVDFFSVVTRGSQFKVESFLFRLGKPENYVFISPSKLDVGAQNAAECMPLIMEPLSAFYNSPLLVLDFQSLYPSIMIAYNYCYSTCLGRVAAFQGKNKFGVTELTHSPGLLNAVKDNITIAPNGIMYVTSNVRHGLLGRMLKELLETRVMVKQAMKTNADDKALIRVLNARQLGLKYIANVTYGYTGATFSGRMPAVEIADSIVQSGRETLEKAIRLIDSTPRWGAQVVYGDTDSLFVYLKGRTKDQAFRIGHDIADTITAMNPPPVKLKFEKVYLPCVLLAKKRYVGFKYEHPDETEPVFDAKGIETVRRDGVPAQRKMVEVCLKKLFRSQDLSEIKEYCCRSWTKILDEKASLQDFIFAKEVRMGTYSDAVPPPPGVLVAARRALLDSNDESQYGDRVPYIITRGQPGARLVERAFSPGEVLNNGKRLDAQYYITRVLIPPLERIFNLVGADVRSWYDEMPKPLRVDQAEGLSPSKTYRDRTAIVDRHFPSAECIICGNFAWSAICEDCNGDAPPTTADLLDLIRKAEKRHIDTQQVCASCSEVPPPEAIACVSLDCPWLYERKKSEQNEEYLEALTLLLADVGREDVDEMEGMASETERMDSETDDLNSDETVVLEYLTH